MYGGREELVVFECRDSLAGVMIDRFGFDPVFHKTDFGFKFSLRVMVSPTFFAWVLGFGDQIKILGPSSVVDELKEMIPLGSPIVYAPVYSELGEKYIAGKSFDDKACGAIAARAIIDTPREELAGDVYLSLSAREETSRLGGVSASTFKIDPDYAFVIDVNLGNGPDIPSSDTVKLGGGISISLSAATHRGLTKATIDLCKEKELPVMAVASPSHTGTNSPSVNLVRAGVPTVDVGLPLRNMHTYNEVINLDDCNVLCGAVREFICSAAIAEEFGREDIL
jgi:endoglucanase